MDYNPINFYANIIDCNPLKMDYNPIIFYANQIHHSRF